MFACVCDLPNTPWRTIDITLLGSRPTSMQTMSSTATEEAGIGVYNVH